MKSSGKKLLVFCKDSEIKFVSCISPEARTNI